MVFNVRIKRRPIGFIASAVQTPIDQKRLFAIKHRLSPVYRPSLPCCSTPHLLPGAITCAKTITRAITRTALRTTVSLKIHRHTRHCRLIGEEDLTTPGSFATRSRTSLCIRLVCTMVRVLKMTNVKSKYALEFIESYTGSRTYREKRYKLEKYNNDKMPD